MNLHAGPVFTPAGTGRRDRRRARFAARRLIREHQARDRAIRQRTRRADRAMWDVPRLPRSGPPGQAGGRSWLRPRVQPHHATSASLGVLYPFIAGRGFGAAGMYIGPDLLSGCGFCFDPWDLYQQKLITNPNVLLAGVIGQGKSTLAKALAWRSVPFGRKVYIPADVKGEWTPVVEAANGQVIRLGPGQPTRLNPLDEGARPSGIGDDEWRTLTQTRRRQLLTAITETVVDGPLTPVEHTALTTALDVAEQSVSTPTLPHVVDHLLAPSPLATDLPADDVAILRDDGRRAGHALRRLIHGDLAGLVDGPSTTRLDAHAPMVSLDISALGENHQSLPVIMTCVSSWLEGALQDPAAGKSWIIYDEGWRLMAFVALLRRMRSQWKLSRGLGLANMVVIHRLSDLDAIGDHGSEARELAAGLLADCSTRIMYRQENDQLAQSTDLLGLTSTQVELLPELGIGESLWRIGKSSHVIVHLLSDLERKLFDTDSRMVGDTH